MKELIHLTLIKEKITEEVRRKLWLPLVLILKKEWEGLCFWYPCCVALVAAMFGDKKFKRFARHCQNLNIYTFQGYDFGQRFSLALILLLFSLLLLLLYLLQLLFLLLLLLLLLILLSLLLLLLLLLLLFILFWLLLLLFYCSSSYCY